VQLSSFSFVYSDNFPEQTCYSYLITKIKFNIGIEKYRTFTAAERMKQRFFLKYEYKKTGNMIECENIEKELFSQSVSSAGSFFGQLR